VAAVQLEANERRCTKLPDVGAWQLAQPGNTRRTGKVAKICPSP
jgi:hypothetical protein